MKNKRGFFLRLLISFLAMGGLVYALRGKMLEAIHILHKGFRWEWFLLAVAANFLGTAVISWRLQLVFKVQEVRVKVAQAFYLSILGLFFNLFFPSSMGGDVAKGYFAYQYSGKKMGSLTGVLLDRLLGFVSIILIALAALGFYSQKIDLGEARQLIYAALVLLVFGVLFFANHRFAKAFRFLAHLVPSSKWKQNLSDLYHSIRTYGNHKRLLFYCVVLSFVGQFIFLLVVYMLSRGLGLSLSFVPFLILVPLIAFMSMAPSLSGLGVREAGFVFFFKSLIPSEQAFALSILFDLLYYGCALAAGLIFAFRGGLKAEVIHDLEQVEGMREVQA